MQMLQQVIYYSPKYNFMRSPALKPMLLFFAACQLLASCQKETAPIEETTLNNDETEMQLLERRCRRQCLVTRTSDDLVSMTPNIFYNRRNDPDSILFEQSATVVVGKYDKYRRLKTVYFSNSWSHEEFLYKRKFDYFPSTIKYYTSNYTDYGMADSLNASMYFKYDRHGNVIEYRYENHWYPGYDFTLNFVYNQRGNVKKIIRTRDGSTPFTEYRFESYDNKPNFMTGSPWTKFMLLNTGYEPYYFLMFSENNAVNWSWKYDPSAASLNFNSEYKYNNRGFASNVFIDLDDSDGAKYGGFTRTSCSTCDDNDCGSTTALGRKSRNAVLQQIFTKYSSSLSKTGKGF